MGEPPIGRNAVFCGVKIFRIADGNIVERWTTRTVT
jgi:predicted ester cyclase